MVRDGASNTVHSQSVCGVCEEKKKKTRLTLKAHVVLPLFHLAIVPSEMESPMLGTTSVKMSPWDENARNHVGVVTGLAVGKGGGRARAPLELKCKKSTTRQVESESSGKSTCHRDHLCELTHVPHHHTVLGERPNGPGKRAPSEHGEMKGGQGDGIMIANRLF